jgi:uncharacterized SAM-binding protein YcdF (DUF218 family)
MKNIIIILGSPNSPNGRLSKIAIGRAKKCLEIFNPEKDMILCTGGFGFHFNISPKPHADYLQRYLMKNGISKNYFLPFANSSNTVEDATKAKEILVKNITEKVIIITTDYHLKRVQLIFDEIMINFRKTYIGVPNKMSARSLLKFEKHEAKAIEGILRAGLYY